MNTASILIAGFGGQGALFAGKFLAYSGLIEGKHLSWLPSYGPEMRGGTANCAVTLSDEPVGSPIITEPNVLIAMNRPSFDKFEPAVVKGGYLFADSTLIDAVSERDDIKDFYIPATQMANDMGLAGLSNMILIGKMLKETGVVSVSDAKEAFEKFVPTKKAALIEKNIEALKAGFDY